MGLVHLYLIRVPNSSLNFSSSRNEENEESLILLKVPGLENWGISFFHSPRNRNINSSFSPFLEEDNFMRNWEL